MNRQDSQPGREIHATSHRESAALLSKPNGDKQEGSSGAARGSCQAHGPFRGGAPPGWAHDGADSALEQVVVRR